MDEHKPPIQILATVLDSLQGKDGRDGKDGETGPQGGRGIQGEKGKDGVDGADGEDGLDGKDGKDGVDGKDGEKGEKGDPGKDGRDGTDGKDAEPVSHETVIQITTPIILQNVQKAVSSKTITTNDVQGLAEYVQENSSATWDYYATNWSVAPTLNSSITGGDVYDYTLNGTTRYRFIPTTYDATQDAFYTTFSGGVLTGIIIARG